VRITDSYLSNPPAREHEDEEEEINDSWQPSIRLSFQGSHVFAGIRQLVEKGIIDGEKMPGWMTGEVGVSIGVVKNGRMEPPGAVI